MKKILSIDGGGIKGVFPASDLATTEDSFDDTWIEDFEERFQIEKHQDNEFRLIIGVRQEAASS